MWLQVLEAIGHREEQTKGCESSWPVNSRGFAYQLSVFLIEFNNDKW